MHATISKFDKTKADEIEEAANDEWNWKTNSGGNEEISLIGQDNLCGGESEEHFANRLAAAIFDANGGPCEIHVNAICMEDLPYESYHFDKDKLPR
jgi:hypothetical protein